MRQGRLDAARSHYQSAIESDPDRPLAHTSLATVLQMLGRKQEAIACLKQCILRNPTDVYANWKLGAAMEDQGGLDEAVAHYRRALSIEPDYVDGHLGLASVFTKQGRKDDAIRHYREVVRIDPAHVAGHTLAALSGGNPERASSQYVERLFDDFADTFDELLTERLKYNVPRLLVTVVEKVAKPQPGQWNILDLGCGTGLVGEAVATYARQLVGVDLSSKMLAKAAARNVYHRLEKQDLLAAMQGESASTYDLVIAADVFVYLGKLDEIIHEARRLLRPGGLIAFSIEDIAVTADEPAGPIDTADFLLTHTGRYQHSLEYIQRLAIESRFDVRHMGSVQGRLERAKPVDGHIAVWSLREG